MPTTRGPGRRRSDPRFAWYASSAEVDTVMIDGRPRVRIVKLVGADVAASISEARRRDKAMARGQAFRSEAEPATA
jgi:hypothetical protein